MFGTALRYFRPFCKHDTSSHSPLSVFSDAGFRSTVIPQPRVQPSAAFARFAGVKRLSNRRTTFLRSRDRADSARFATFSARRRGAAKPFNVTVREVGVIQPAAVKFAAATQPTAQCFCGSSRAPISPESFQTWPPLLVLLAHRGKPSFTKHNKPSTLPSKVTRKQRADVRDAEIAFAAHPAG